MLTRRNTIHSPHLCVCVGGGVSMLLERQESMIMMFCKHNVSRLPTGQCSVVHGKPLECLSICRQFNSFETVSGLLSTMSKIYCLMSTSVCGMFSHIVRYVSLCIIITLLTIYISPSQLTYPFLFFFLFKYIYLTLAIKSVEKESYAHF